MTLREQLAELEHIQWAAWTRWQLDHPENRERWERQIATPYAELTEREKDSDREWADKVLALLDAEQKRVIARALIQGELRGLKLALENSMSSLSRGFLEARQTKLYAEYRRLLEAGRVPGDD